MWEDEDSMREFRESDLAATIPEAYRVEGDPRVEVFESSPSFAPNEVSHRRVESEGGGIRSQREGRAWPKAEASRSGRPLSVPRESDEGHAARRTRSTIRAS